MRWMNAPRPSILTLLLPPSQPHTDTLSIRLQASLRITSAYDKISPNPAFTADSLEPKLDVRF